MTAFDKLVDQQKKKRKGQNQDILEALATNRVSEQLSSDDDIAPIRSDIKDENEWFTTGAFGDDEGNFLTDTLATVGATAADVALPVAKGFASLSEGISDLILHGTAYGAGALGFNDAADFIHESANISFIDTILSGAEKAIDRNSVLGKKVDAIVDPLASGIGYMGGIMATGGGGSAMGLGAAGTSALTTGAMFTSSAGSGISEAYHDGATDEEAIAYGVSKGAIDAASELVFGGLGKTVKALGLSTGLVSLDDMFAKALSDKISNRALKTLAQYGVKASAEGVEEVLAGLGSAVAKNLTYMSDRELGQLIEDENLLEQFLVGTVTSGIMQSGILPGTSAGSVKESIRTGRDFITGYSQNEEAVIKKETENRIAEKEKDGKKLSGKEKSAIQSQVEKDLEKGYISTDTIEEVLGGETYKSYKDTVDSEDSILNEYEELGKKQNATLAEQSRYNELSQKAKDIQANSKRKQLKSQLSEEVFGLAKNDRLVESYNERSRKGQAFEADLSQYDAKQQAVIQKAVESGILNNTNRTHEFVDMIAKISADKGVLFDFANNEKLKESGFAIDGKTINGYVTKDGVTINIQSAKALNSVVGHEITHVLEGTELYAELQTAVFEFAKTKGDYQGRYDALAKLYENVDGANIDAELTADLVGDYLFTDADFVNTLSVNHRNVFQKIYDEVKYLLKVATAGSKEARQLEKVKKAFEDAYRAETKNPTGDGGTKYSISQHSAQADVTAHYQAAVDQVLNMQNTKQDHLIIGYTPDVYSSLGMPSLPFVIGTGHVYSAAKTEAEAKQDGNYRKGINYHGLGSNVIKNIYEALKDPVMIIASKDVNKNATPMRSTHSVVAIVDVGNSQKSLLLPVEITAERSVNGARMDVNALSSVYEKTVSNLVNEAIALENSGEVGIYYAKKEALTLPGAGVQFPVRLQQSIASSGIIHSFSEKVNMNIKDATQSRQFKRWFGDWQNHPENASKVVNEDGTPKVMYHGSPNQFTVFDKKKAKSTGHYGKGFYFTDSAEQAGVYGNQYSVYLDVKHPLQYGEDTVNRAQVQSFLEAVAENEDYSIENYGTYDVDAILDTVMGSQSSGDAFRIIQDINATAIGDMVEAAELFNSINGTRFDGIIVPTETVVFRPEQIKSATDNIGTFDGSNPDIRYSLSEEADKTYIDAVNRGDTETMQKMVDEAAKESGYEYKGYHGSRNNGFTVFDDKKNDLGQKGFFFSSVPDVAKSYMRGTESAMYSCYIRMDSPLVVEGRRRDWHSINFAINPSEVGKYEAVQRKDGFWEIHNIEGRVSIGRQFAWDTKERAIEAYENYPAAHPTKAVMKSTRDIVRYAYNSGKYDGVVIKNTIDMGDRNAKRKISTLYIPFASEQIKSADPVTYDDSGNVIPLSERFKQENDDIRYSLSDLGESPKTLGNYKVYGEDIELQDSIDDIAPIAENATTADNTEAVADASVVDTPRPSTRKGLHQNIIDRFKATFADRGFDFDDVLKRAKNLSTFATVDNTPQRVMEKSLGYKEGGVLADLTVNMVAQNETEGIKWLNSITDRKNGLLAQLSKQYNIKPGSKESSAAQMYAEGFYVGENNEIIQYGDRELAMDFPDINVQRNIKGLASDERIRNFYDSTLEMINESRTRNLYPEIPRLDNYHLHFRAMDDTFSRLGLPFNPNDIRAKDLPTDLNGVTADLKPGQPYFASAKHREGKRTSFDILGGLERYATSAKNQIFHIDDIQNLRALRNYIADTYGQANGLSGLDELTEEEAQERIKDVYNSHLSTFAKFLNEEANVLAGKTALIDRGVEGIIGRRGITFLDTVNKQVGSNLIGYSMSSPLTNFDAIPRAFVKANKADFVKAFGQMVVNTVTRNNDGFAENSPVIIRRKGADRFYRTPWQKMSDPGYALMGIVDEISTELVARAKYNELTRKGMDTQEAHFETDKWVSKLMGDRSLGQQPQLFNSKMLGLLTKFQLEVRNNLDSMFYDSIQEAKVSNEHIQDRLERNARTAAKATATITSLAIAQHLFGTAFESVAGYNPSFDIIEAIIQAFGWDDEEEEPVLDNLEEAFLTLVDDLPYSSTFTGGRIPISNALPISELIKGVDQYGNEKSRWETVAEVAPYYLLPAGYGQIKKTAQGLGMFSDDHPIAGSYTDSGKLRFPVDDTIGSRVQAAMFGQYASQNARDYFDEDRSALTEKQTQEFIDSDLPIRDYWEYRDGLKGLTKISEKADYIDSLDLPISTKNLFINNIADRKEPIDMAEYSEYDSFEEFDYAQSNPEKYDFLTEVGVSYRQYKYADEDKKRYYSDAFEASEKPEQQAMSKAVADNFLTYYQFTKDINNIKADKDNSGKSIRDSRKEKVYNHIFNEMDIDYGAKLILFKNEYNADDTYNMEIIEYLNNKSDLTFSEKLTILKKLGFTVSNDGKITWD